MRLLLAALGAALIWASPAVAQATYPTQPVRVIVGFAAGGGMDAIARQVADRLSGILGQQVVVENRAGAGGTIAAAYTAGARADGYTLYLGETSALFGPMVYDDVGYDPLTSFAPVAHLTISPLAFVANPSLEAQNLEEFIELARANPGEFFYATPGVATVQHLAIEMLQDAAGIELEDLPFQGGAPSLTAVISGEVPLAITSLGAAVSQAEGGAVRILGITAPDRLENFPDLPAISETVEGFSASPSQFLLAPADTPAEVLEVLSNAVAEAMADEGLIEALTRGGFIPDYKSAADLAAEMPETVQRWTSAVEAVDTSGN